MGFTLFGEKYKYEVDSINIGFFVQMEHYQWF